MRARTPQFLLDRHGQRLRPLEREHLARASAYASTMGDDSFFTHVTAAVAWGLPLPLYLLRGSAIHVGVSAPARLPRGRGVRGHEVAPWDAKPQVDETTGLLLPPPATVWAMLGSMIRDERDLVAAGDAVIREWRVTRPLSTITEMTRTVHAGRRVGIQRLRDALPLLRTGSASRPETWARLILRAAGMPEPELNYEIIVAGAILACVDLAYPAAMIAIEYEGEHHLLDPEQWARDIRRYEQLTALGWTVIRLTKADVFTASGGFTSRVHHALAATTLA